MDKKEKMMYRLRIPDNLIVSGDEKLILSILSLHFKSALEIFMKELNSGHLELSEELEGVFEYCE